MTGLGQPSIFCYPITYVKSARNAAFSKLHIETPTQGGCRGRQAMATGRCQYDTHCIWQSPFPHNPQTISPGSRRPALAPTISDATGSTEVRLQVCATPSTYRVRRVLRTRFASRARSSPRVPSFHHTHHCKHNQRKVSLGCVPEEPFTA